VLVLFLIAIAWTAWPAAVLVMSGVAGTLFSLQFIVYGLHRAALAALWVFRAGARAGAAVWRRGAARIQAQTQEQTQIRTTCGPNVPGEGAVAM